MSELIHEEKTWSRKQWMLAIGGIFLLQVGLLYTERGPRKNETPASQPRYQLFSRPITSGQLTRTFFASDPTLYSGASLHSFSGPAWLRISPNIYGFPDYSTSSNHLDLNVAQLGCLPELRAVAKLADSQSGELAKPPAYAPFLDAEPPVETQSVVRIEGPLASRAIDVPAKLPAWSSAEPGQVLKNTEVMMAVDGAGMVISARFDHDGRSGSAAADYEALEIARLLRFTPLKGGSGVVYGKLVVEWRTMASMESNAGPSKNM